MKKQILFLVMIIAVMGVVSGCRKTTEIIKQGVNSKVVEKNSQNIQETVSTTTKQVLLKEEIKHLPNGDIDISNWKTYRNEEMGVEMKYPNNWTFVEEAGYPRTHFYYDGIARDEFSPFDFGEAVWIQKIIKADWIENKSVKPEKIMIDGFNGEIYKNIPGGQEPGSVLMLFDELVIDRNGYNYIIELYNERASTENVQSKSIKPGWVRPVDQKIFDKILTTFRFIK